jgi:hypothetical protein
MLGGRFPKLDLVTLKPPWCLRFAAAGPAKAAMAITAERRTTRILETLGMTPPVVVDTCIA